MFAWTWPRLLFFPFQAGSKSYLRVLTSYGNNFYIKLNSWLIPGRGRKYPRPTTGMKTKPYHTRKGCTQLKGVFFIETLILKTRRAQLWGSESSLLSSVIVSSLHQNHIRAALICGLSMQFAPIFLFILLSVLFRQSTYKRESIHNTIFDKVHRRARICVCSSG